MTNRSTIRTSATSHLSTRGIADWRSRSACLDEDPELFFPTGNTGPALLQIEDAKAVCARCPVHMECLRWAMTIGVSDGVWGGHAADEIRNLKRRRTRGSQSRRRSGGRSTASQPPRSWPTRPLPCPTSATS